MDRRGLAGRALLAAIATVVASVAILATLMANYASVLTDPTSFSNRAVRVVHTGGVESLVVNTITGRVLGEVGDQTSLEPMIRAAVGRALSDAGVTDEVRAAAHSLQNQLASGRAHVLTLSLPGIGPAVASTVQASSPQLAEAVGRIGTVTVLDVGVPPTAASALHDLTVLGRDSALLIVFSVAMVALALILSPDRRRTLVGLGLGAAVSGLLAAAIYLVGRGLVVDQFAAPGARTAAGAAWGVYLGGLESSGLVVAGIGALVAAMAALTRRGRSRHEPRLATV